MNTKCFDASPLLEILPAFLPSIDTLHGVTVGDLANTLYKGKTFDYALPQPWVDSLPFDPCGQTVWLYDGIFGYPAPLTKECYEKLMTYVYK